MPIPEIHLEMPDTPGIEDAPIPVRGLSPHECYLGFQTESLAAFEKNRSRHLGRLTWGILDLPFDEMRALGSKLSPESTTIMRGFRDIEGFITDYILAGISNLRKAGSIATIHGSWSGDEFIHPIALDNMMEASGMFTDSELYDQTEETLAEIWTPSQHRGLHSPAGYIAFSTFQERGTYLSYYRFIKHVRGEYGLPPEVTSEERARGMEYGISEGLRRIAGVEIYHHGVFLEQLKLLYKYFPEHTLLVVDEVLDPFSMPAMNLIPQGRQFLRALLRTGVYKKDTQEEEVIKPTLSSLGFPGRDLFNLAVEQAKVSVQSDDNKAHPRLFYVPRTYYSRHQLEAMAYNSWLDERQKKTPDNLGSLEEYDQWAMEYGSYVSPFAEVTNN